MSKNTTQEEHLDYLVEGLLGNNVFNTCYSMLKEVRKKR